MYPIAKLVNDVVFVVMLSDSNQSDKIRMVSNPHRSHDLAFKLFLSICRSDVVFNSFDCDLSSSPLALENLR